MTNPSNILRKREDCHCENIDFGTYANTVGMVLPFDLPEMNKKKGDLVVIDTCIATEIGYLWHQGIRTLNSCCGHKKMLSSVVVTEDSIEKMLELGYKNWQGEKMANPKQTFHLPDFHRQTVKEVLEGVREEIVSWYWKNNPDRPRQSDITNLLSSEIDKISR